MSAGRNMALSASAADGASGGPLHSGTTTIAIPRFAGILGPIKHQIIGLDIAVARNPVTMQPKVPLRARIPSYMPDIQQLSEIFNWLPSGDQLQPSAATMLLKESARERTMALYSSGVDQILEQLFGLESELMPDGRMFVTAETRFAAQQCKKFSPHPFPYEVPDGTHHYFMWYNLGPPHITEEEVTADVEHEVDKKAKAYASMHSSGLPDSDELPAQFAWYEAPPGVISVPEIYHVHVFWRSGGGGGRPPASTKLPPMGGVMNLSFTRGGSNRTTPSNSAGNSSGYGSGTVEGADEDFLMDSMTQLRQIHGEDDDALMAAFQELTANANASAKAKAAKDKRQSPRTNGPKQSKSCELL